MKRKSMWRANKTEKCGHDEELAREKEEIRREKAVLKGVRR